MKRPSPTTLFLRGLALGALLLAPLACTPSDDAAGPTADTTAAEAAMPTADAPAEPALPPRSNEEARVSPNARVAQTIGTTEVVITYGRPAVNGRDVFGGLEPYDAVWRAGANEATVFATTGDVTVNGQALPAGVYALFAIPTQSDWTLIFNAEAAQWGAFDYDESKDVLRVTVTPEEGPAREWLDYYFENLTDTSATAVLHWSTTRVPFTIGTGM